jgi:hypothetical protein
MDAACITYGGLRDFVRKLEGKRPPVGPRHRWEDNNKMDLHKVGMEAWTGLNWLKIGTGGGHL